MSLVEQQISGYVPSQLPRIIQAEGPEFVAFCKAYYQFLEQEGGINAQGRAISEYRDIDTTLDQFLDHWIKKYMSGVPVSILGNIRVLQKHIKELFSSKGTIQGLKLLFQLLYGQEVTVYYPGQDILKPSDGTWNQPSYVEITSSDKNVLLIGQIVTGRESNASAIVEDFQTRVVNGKAINLLYLSNQRGVFNTGEILLNPITSNTLECPVIIGSMTDIEVNESGFNYKVGDVLAITGGSGISGKAVVSKVSPRSGAVTFTISDGGSGYANNNTYAPTIIDITPVSNSNPGIGAAFKIGNISNTSIITTPVDVISPYGNTTLGSTDYGFPPGESFLTNYTANSAPFATGNGTANSFQLSVASQTVTVAQPIAAGSVYRTDWQGRQLLVTTPRTNLIKQSGSVGISPWLVANTGVANTPVITANFAQAPDGTNTASRVQMTLNGGTTVGDSATFYQTVTVSAGNTYTRSIWLKSNSGANCALMFRDDVSGSPQPVYNVTTSWQQFTLTNTVPSTGANLKLWLRATQGTSNTADLLVWGGQMELGSNVTPYIPTTSTAVTVTDYSQNNFAISLGQSPAIAAKIEAGAFTVGYGDGVANTFPAFAVDRTNWQGRILLNPAGRTNRAFWSTDFTQAVWQKTAGGVGSAPIITANSAIAPDGSNTAVRVQLALNGGSTGTDQSVVTQLISGSVIVGTPYTQGIWVMANGVGQVGKTILMRGAGAASFNIITLTSSWQFVGKTETSVVTPITITIVGLRGTLGSSDSADFFMWGPQFEAGNNATAYIPTIGASNTVTDYTFSNTGAISTATAPIANAVLDWSGTYVLNGSNFNTPLNQALNIQNITVGTITSLTAINPGAGYNGPININVHNDVIGGLQIIDPNRGTIEGLNAVVLGAATAGNGAIDQVQVLDSGFGYLNGDVVTFEGANNNSVAGGVVQLGHAGHSQGYWSDTKSFLNADKYIEDSHYYQDYSYEVQASISYDKYNTLLKNFWHPAGTISFGKVVIFNEDDSGSSVSDLQIQNVFQTTFMHSFSALRPTAFLTSTSYATQVGTTYFTAKPTQTSRGTQTRVLSGLQEQLVNGTFPIDLSNWVTASGNVEWNAVQAMALGNTSSGGQAYQGFAANVGGTYWISTDILQFGGGALHVWVSPTTNTADYIAQSGASTGTHIGFNFVATQPVMYIIMAGTAGSVTVDNVSAKQLPSTSTPTQRITSQSTTTVYGTAFSTSRSTTTVFNTTFVTSFGTGAFTASAFATTRATIGSTATTFSTAFATSKLTNLITTTTFDTSKAASRSTASVYDTTFDTTIVTSRITTTTGSTSYATNFATITNYNTIYLTAFATNFATATVTAFDTTQSTSKSTTTVFNTTYGTTYGTLSPTAYATATQLATSRTTTYLTNYLTSYITTYATTFGTTIATTFVTNATRQTATTAATSALTATSRTTTFNTVFDTTRATSVTTSRNTAFFTATTASTSRTTTFITNFVSTYDTSVTTTFDTSVTTTFGTAASRATQTFIQTSALTATSAPVSRATETSRLTVYACVTADSFLNEEILARDVKRGMFFKTWTPTEGFQKHEVEAAGPVQLARSFRIITSSNANLVTSETTPFNLKTSTKDLEEGHWKYAPDMLGEEVLVTHGDQEAVWEEIVAIIDEGLREIVPISFGGRSFAAGETPEAKIYSHNMAKPSNFSFTRITSYATTTTYNSTFNTSTVYFSFYNTTTSYVSQTARTTAYATSRVTAFATSVATSASTSRTTTFITTFNTTTTIVTTFVSNYNTAYATNFDTSRTTTFNTTTAFITTFNTTTAFASTVTRNTTYDTSQLTSALTSATTSTPTSLVTTYLTTFNTDTTILTLKDTVGQTTIATNFATTTTYLTAFNTTRSTLTTTVFDTTLATSRATSASTTTTFDTTIATAKNTTTSFNTSYATNFSTTVITTTLFQTMLATNFATSTQFATTYDTSALTQRITNTAYITTFDTTTNKLTTIITSRNTSAVTNFATTTVFDTVFDTNKSTTTSFGTTVITTYVVIPTTFQTFYNTNTMYPTTYMTDVITTASTDTTIDTEYPTSRVTSIATGTSLLPPQ